MRSWIKCGGPALMYYIQTLYKMVDTALSRYPDLRRLDLRYLRNDAGHSAPRMESSVPLTATETTRLGQWTKHCSRLEWVGLLSGYCWRRTVATASSPSPPV